MAKSAMTWEGRRALTDDPNTGAVALKQAARELMDNNLLADAATFFALAHEKEAGKDKETETALGEIAARAVEEGDFFLFQAAAAKLGPAMAREQLDALLLSAEKNGKALYAERAAKYLETFSS